MRVPVAALLLVSALAFSCESGSPEQLGYEPCGGTWEAPSDDAEARGAPTGTIDWADRAPSPTPRIGYAAAAVNGRIHLVGTIGADGATHDIYDPAADAWYGGRDLPVRTDHPWAASAVGRLYVGDGLSHRVFCYDPGHDEWVEVASSPRQHGRTASVGVIESRIYVAGGGGTDTDGVELSVYDPASDSWASISPMSCARDHASGGVLEGRFHVVGGRPGSQVCHEAYDPGTDTWTRLADLPTGRSGMAGAVVGGWLFVVGGEGNPDGDGGLFGAVEAYDPNNDRWRSFTDMPTPRHGIFASTVGDTLYIPTGGRMTSAFRTNQVLIVEREP